MHRAWVGVLQSEHRQPKTSTVPEAVSGITGTRQGSADSPSRAEASAGDRRLAPNTDEANNVDRVKGIEDNRKFPLARDGSV